VSLETRIEKLEASKPVDAVAEAAIVMRRVKRACAGLPADQADAKMHAIFKYVSDEVLQVIANMTDDEGSGDESPDDPLPTDPLPPSTLRTESPTLSPQEPSHEQ